MHSPFKNIAAAIQRYPTIFCAAYCALAVAAVLFQFASMGSVSKAVRIVVMATIEHMPADEVAVDAYLARSVLLRRNGLVLATTSFIMFAVGIILARDDAGKSWLRKVLHEAAICVFILYLISLIVII
jgi:hypothetical protein